MPTRRHSKSFGAAAAAPSNAMTGVMQLQKTPFKLGSFDDSFAFAEGQVVKVGTRIKFIGTIKKAYGDGTFDIVYQDGKYDYDIPLALVSEYDASTRVRSASASSEGSVGNSRCRIEKIDIEDAVSHEWASIAKVLPAGKRIEVGPISVSRAGALVEWKFAVLQGDDVDFSVLFADGTHVPEVVVEEALYAGVGRGRLFVDQPGDIMLRWSNQLSFISAKKIRYRARLTYPDAAESPLRRAQITKQMLQTRKRISVLRALPTSGRPASGLRALEHQAFEALGARESAQQQIRIMMQRRKILQRRSPNFDNCVCNRRIEPPARNLLGNSYTPNVGNHHV